MAKVGIQIRRWTATRGKARSCWNDFCVQRHAQTVGQNLAVSDQTGKKLSRRFADRFCDGACPRSEFACHRGIRAGEDRMPCCVPQQMCGDLTGDKLL